eukprot:17032-Heterococcus_DN1.PRE.5
MIDKAHDSAATQHRCSNIRSLISTQPACAFVTTHAYRISGPHTVLLSLLVLTTEHAIHQKCRDNRTIGMATNTRRIVRSLYRN